MRCVSELNKGIADVVSNAKMKDLEIKSLGIFRKLTSSVVKLRSNTDTCFVLGWKSKVRFSHFDLMLVIKQKKGKRKRRYEISFWRGKKVGTGGRGHTHNTGVKLFASVCLCG